MELICSEPTGNSDQQVYRSMGRSSLYFVADCEGSAQAINMPKTQAFRVSIRIIRIFFSAYLQCIAMLQLLLCKLYHVDMISQDFQVRCFVTAEVAAASCSTVVLSRHPLRCIVSAGWEMGSACPVSHLHAHD